MRTRILLVTFLLAGCGESTPEPSESPSPPVPPAPQTPEPFAAEAIPAHLEQYRVAFSVSGDTAWVGGGEGFFPATRQATIHRIVRGEGGWEGWEAAGFSDEGANIDPFLDPEGRVLYFSSIREGRDAVDLWRVERSGSGWGTPERLALSSDEDELYPSVDAAGRLYFARPLPEGHWGIWVAEPRGDGWEEPRPLGPEVNRPGTWNFNPTVTAEGDRLLFTRLIPAEAAATGFGQIHLAEREGEAWGEARPLTEAVNTQDDEFHPALSRDGRTLYFVRRDPTAEEPRGRLFQVHFEAVLPR